MPIQRANLLSMKPLKTPARHHPQTLTELKNVLQDTQILIEPLSVNTVIPFILWQDTWNEIGFFGPKRKNSYRKEATLKYSRGRKVFVDLGYNVGDEGSLPHPAIVLRNFKDMMVVIPTTSNDNNKILRMEPDIQKMNLVVPADGTIFPNETILQLHQIRIISKNCIIKDLGCNIENYIPKNDWIDQVNAGLKCSELIPYGINLLKVLEMKLCAHYAPDMFHQILKLKKQVQQLEEEKQTLVRQLEELGAPHQQIAPSTENESIS